MTLEQILNVIFEDYIYDVISYDEMLWRLVAVSPSVRRVIG